MGMSLVLNLYTSTRSTSSGSSSRMASIFSLASILFALILASQANSTKISARFSNEDACKRLIPDMVAMASSTGRVIIRSISAGVASLYGICTIIWGISMPGNFSSGNNREVATPKISNEIKIMQMVTGLRRANAARLAPASANLSIHRLLVT